MFRDLNSARALALDLGSTRVKAALLDATGALLETRAFDAPAAQGKGAIRESDPYAWRALVARALEELEVARELPIGLSVQRSSFCLFRRRDGRAVTPLISWQDRRAARWCEERRALEPRFRELTGLVLSPHYVATKLAVLAESDPQIARELLTGELQVATLDTWILDALDERGPLTDLTVAARTGLVELERGEWSDELLATFGVSRRALAEIEFGVADRGRVRAHLADQSASALATLEHQANGALVNLGTGGFVLAPIGDRVRRVDGYLTGPLCSRPREATRYALEGTINGGGATADRFAPGPTEFPARDPTPGLLALPDENGIGAPYWRACDGPRFSLEPERCAPGDLRRAILEGLAFRVRAILEDLLGGERLRANSTAPIRLAGGLARDPYLPRALAALLERPIEIVPEFEASLLAVGRLALGLEPASSASATVLAPQRGDAWLVEKFERWRAFIAAGGCA